MGLFDPKCKACEKRTPRKKLKEDYCPDCHEILTDYCDLRDKTQAMFGKTINLNPKDVVKMSGEEIQTAISDLFHVETPKTIHGFANKFDKGITLEALRDDFEVKRVKYVTRPSGADGECMDCRKRNGLIIPIDEAISLGLHIDSVHKECGQWVPLSERQTSLA